MSKEPDWQAAGEQHGRDFRAGLRDGAFGAIGLAIVALLAILWARREQPQRFDPPATPISQPPSDLKPSLAALLTGSHGGMGALLLELVRRGVLQVEEIKHSRWTSRDYQVELCGKPSGLAPHERSFLELLFKDGARSTRLSESAARVSGGWPKIAAAIKHELRQAGLIDEERSRTRRGLMAASGMGLLLGFAVFVAGMVLSKEDGSGPVGGRAGRLRDRSDGDRLYRPRPGGWPLPPHRSRRGA